MAELGCGTYAVQVVTRGGARLVHEVPYGQLEWSRRPDETSQAKVSGVKAAECCELLRDARPWKHELAVYRDGVPVWAGPIVGIDPSDQNDVQIDARDLTAWWDHRRVHADLDFSAATDLATIFEAVSEDAMGVDNTPGLFAKTSPSGVLGTLTVKAAEHKMAGPKLRELADAGIDWTAVGREVRAGGLVVPTRRLGTFLDQHFLEPPVPTRDGQAQANSWIVAGAGTGPEGDAVFGEASDAALAEEDGLLESVDSTSLEQQTAAQAAAESRLALTGRVETIDKAVLSPRAPFPLADLVPGALCRISLSRRCGDVEGLFRIGPVDVQEGPGPEQVSVTFHPVGTTA